MKRLGLHALTILLAIAVPLACVGSPKFDDDTKGHPDFDRMATQRGGRWQQPLMPLFEEAAARHDVPLPLLLTLGYFGSAFENRGDAPTIEGGYGVMALRENKTGGKSLAEGEELTKAPKEKLKVDPKENINAAAAVLAHYAKKQGIDKSKGLEAWLGPVIEYAGLEEEFSRLFAMEIFQKLQSGLDWTNSSGERFYFPPQDIGAVDLNSLIPREAVRITNISDATPAAELGGDIPPIVGSSDYPPAIWYPAASCNYSAYYTAKDTIVVHTIEGTAAGCLSWFRNCNAQVSAHYVVSEAGTVWQCVDEDYVAWHVSCYNSRSIGIEHEGYAASPSHPKSLYDASGLLARDICNDWGIPKEKRTVGPGILGHIDVTRCCCGTHTDPGNGWDWNYYISVVQGVPTWGASFHAQSYPSTMTAGSTAIAWVEFVNTGTGAWHHSETYLGTSSPRDRISPFCNPSNWPSCNRPTDVDQWEVTQGNIGRFTFILKAPTTPGTYVEKFQLVREGITWFGPEITWTITVTPAKGNLTGTVRNAANGQPISGATVAISGGPSTTTNSSGVYTFNDLDPATYTLNVSKAGFNPASDTATVTAGQTTTKDFNLVSTDTTPPSAPTGLTATSISPSQINLSWNASTDSGGAGLAGYIIFRNNAEVGRTSATTYQDNGLTQNTTYSYYVKAYDNANNVSGPSNTAVASTQPGTVAIFQDGFATIDPNLWTAIVQSPMPGPYPPVWDGSVNHGTFPGSGSIKTLSSSDPNQGCLLGHTFNPPFQAAKFESWFYDTSANNNSRQGLEIRCHDNSGGIKAIYYLGTYSASPGSFSTYSAGYYKVCGTGCTGWYWPGAACKTRSVGWHKFTIEFLPYTGSGDVKYYIDDTLVCTTDRTLDTQTYGLTMVAYGYHYRVNQEGWFDDCAMYASAPYAPTMGTPVALSTNSIRWVLTDNSNNETGFLIVDSAQAVKASAPVQNGTGGTVNITEGGLSPNTPYTRYAKAYNGTLNSVSSAPATRWTLSNPPTPANVVCNRTIGTWYNTPTFSFTAVGGFGQGTVSEYRYAWDTSPTHTWTGSEPVWNSGNLILTASTPGSYYLHIKGFNGEGVANGTLDLGPFMFDDNPPSNPISASETHGAQNGTWQSTIADPAFTWTGAEDSDSGIAGYFVYFGTSELGTSDTIVSEASFDPPAVDTGTYYLRIRAKDFAGNTADEWKTLFIFKYDSNPPNTPIVEDDGQYSGSRTKLHATWRSTDAHSGIAEYMYAVGTSPGDTSIVNWTSAGASDEAIITIPSPGLSIGTTYYISVKAKDSAGNWSNIGSSDGIQVVAESPTIAYAKGLANATPVALTNKIVTATFANGFYIEEADRSSGILVLGPGPNPGALVTVGGTLGTNASGERAIVDAATIVEAEPDPNRIPKPLFMIGNALGGDWFNAETPGVTGSVALNNIGLLVTICGRVESIGEQEFLINDGSTASPIKAIASGINVGSLIAEDDFVVVTGISSLELDDGVFKPLLRVRTAEDIEKKN